MKSNFNKRQPVTFKNTDGHAVSVLRADIESVRAAENPDQTILTFKKCENHPDGGELHIDQPLDDVVDRLNGQPSAEQKHEWEREILKDIGHKADERLLQIPLERENTVKEINMIAARTEKMLKDRLRTEEFRKQAAEETIARKEKSFFSKIFGKGQEYHAAVAYLAESGDVPDRVREQIEVAREGHARDKELLEDKYRSEITFLENQARDPQMGPADRALLEQKIREHRLGHMEPDFRFVRDPNQKDLARSEFDMHVLNREKARELFDAHKRDHGLGLYRSRDRGYER